METPASPPDAALKALVVEHLDLVYTAALRQLRDPHRAEDVTQTVFLIAAKKLDSIPQRYPEAWLLKTTRYVVLMSLRGERRRRARERSAAKSASSTADFPMENTDAINALADEALAALNEVDRQLLIERFFKNRAVGAIASQLGISDNTVSKRIERALAKVRKLFARRGVDASASSIGAGLLAAEIRPAPDVLRGRVLEATTAGAAGGAVVIPFGVLLMTISAKLKIAAGVAIAIALLGGGYAVVRGLNGPTPSPLSPAPVVMNVSSKMTVGDTTTPTGVVRDAAGRPVGGALVSQGDSPDYVDGYRATRTDANGQFILSDVKVGLELAIAVQSPGFAPELIHQGLVGHDSTPFTISLLPGRRLQFRVVDDRGRPVPDLAISRNVWRMTQVLKTDRFIRGKWSGPLTDANGVVTINNAPADAITFDPVAPDEYLRKSFTLSPSDQLQTVILRDAIKVHITAVDEQSGKAIPSFKVTYGRSDSDATVDYWDNGSPKMTENGAFDTIVNWSNGFHSYRLEAPGYAPSIQKFSDKEARADLTFRLARAAVGNVTIHAPDGSDAVGAELYVVEPKGKSGFSLQSTELLRNGAFSYGQGPTLIRTNEKGNATLPAGLEPEARVVVMHETGFADVRWTDVAKAPSIQLAGWARVSGIAKVGSAVASNRKISVEYSPRRQGQPYISGTFMGTTDDEGRFSFDRVPPGEAYLGLWIETNMGTRFAQGTVGNATGMVMKSGDNDITIGGTGRAIAGRITGANGAAMAHAFYGLGSLRAMNPLPRPELSPALTARLEAIRKLPRDEAQLEYTAYAKEPAFQAFEAALRKWVEGTVQHSYGFVVDQDGTFHADDIEPGKYALTVSVYDAMASQLIGNARHEFTIPIPQAGQKDEPIDLGALTIEPALKK